MHLIQMLWSVPENNKFLNWIAPTINPTIMALCSGHATDALASIQ